MSNKQLKIAIIGPENSGKSSLINLIFGKYISEVSEIGGTTKRPIKKFWGKIKIGRQKKEPQFADVVFVDLGGLYSSDEKKSPIMVGSVLQKTYEEIEDADMIIHIIDGEKGLSKSFEKLHHLLKYRYRKSIIVVINKCDLIDDINRESLKKYVESRLQNRVFLTSATTYEGVDILINAILDIIKR
jgi:hypothetical protein